MMLACLVLDVPMHVHTYLHTYIHTYSHMHSRSESFSSLFVVNSHQCLSIKSVIRPVIFMQHFFKYADHINTKYAAEIGQDCISA